MWKPQNLQNWNTFVSFSEDSRTEFQQCLWIGTGYLENAYKALMYTGFIIGL